VLKTVIFSLQMGFTADFVPDCAFYLFFCVSDRSNFDTAFLPDCTKLCKYFFRLFDRKFKKDSKNVIKTVIFSLQMGFTADFVPDCPFYLCFCQFKYWHRFSPWLYQILLWFFLGYWIGNLIRISKMCLKM